MMGVQVPRRVYAEVSQEAAFRQEKTASGPSVSRSGATEGVAYRGGAFDAGSRSYVDINTPKYSVTQIIGYMKGKSSIWIAQNVERKMMGARILCHDRWPGRGGDPAYRQPC
jgi:hypothetical protein